MFVQVERRRLADFDADAVVGLGLADFSPVACASSLPGTHRRMRPRRCCSYLLALGWIVPGGVGRLTQKPRLPGVGTARVYVFTNKWADAE